MTSTDTESTNLELMDIESGTDNDRDSGSDFADDFGSTIDIESEVLALRTPNDALELPPGHGIGIADVARRLGVSAHTIRYYERAGLVDVPRDAAGRRQFDEHSVRRIEFLRRMRRSGMGVAQLTRYIQLVGEGPNTEPQRLELMLAHRENVRNELHDLHLALAAIEYKITTYGGSLDGECRPARTPHEGEHHDHTA